ncbi:MAG: hypothetical protein N3D18_14770 [Roseococcus sp.]|nr:hypothetical protein [Roseococcus sp.]
MPDLRISQLPAATSLNDADILPIVQGGPNTTRRASVSQIRRQVLADRGVDLRDFGAAGNGTTNDAPALQAAINALGSAGGTIRLGPRTYRLASPVTISAGPIRLIGQGYPEGAGPGSGTWLTVDQTGFFPITFSGLSARGSLVANLAVRQTHAAAQNASWAPTPYDWFFRVLDCLGGVEFENVMLSGINRGIQVKNSGRTDIRRLRGQVFTAGVDFDEIYDVVRIANLHFWPFWSANDHVVRWQQANGDAMIFRRVDGVFVDQSFVLGHRTMFRFSSSAAGYTQKFSIGQAYADFVKHGVLIEAAGTDGQIDSMTVQCEIFNAGGAPVPGSVGLYVNAHSSRVQIGSLRVDDAEDNAIRIEQHSNRLDIGALRIVNFNLRSNGAAAIHVANAASGEPNRVNLGSKPLLETPVMGPLVNAGTNGSVGVLAPAGEAARPGLAVGAAETGFFQPAANTLAASVGGAEVLRAGAGSLSLGGAQGAHGFEVITPGGSLNRMVAIGGLTGTPGRAGWAVSGGDANIDAVIGQPKGTGALIAQFPDNAVGGGAARGANAVDLQTTRTAATQVASGANAVIAGGSGNTASGSGAIVVGGTTNTASNTNSVVVGGQSNTASGLRAVVVGGQSNTAGGNDSWCPGGFWGTARGLYGRGFWAANRFSTAGDAQAGEFLARIQTTDATPARLTQDAGAPATNNTLNLPNNGTYRLKLLVVAQQTGGSAGTVGDCASWECDVLIKRGASASATALVGGRTVNNTPAIAAITAGTPFAPGMRDAGAAGWTLTLAADTTNGGLAITGTGEANKTIRWVARAMSIEVTA